MSAAAPPPPPKSRWEKALSVAQAGLDVVVSFVLMLFAYAVVLFGVITVLNIVSPALVQEQVVLLFVATVVAGVVVLPRILFFAIRQRLNAFPDYSLNTLHADAALKPMILNLRVRSRLYKLGAVTAFVFIAAATLLGFTVAQTAVTQDQVTTGATGDPLTGTAVTAIVLLLFLLRTLASIYRSNMRLAAFYDSRADYLQAGGVTKTLPSKDLLQVFSIPELDPGWTEKLKGAFTPNTPG